MKIFKIVENYLIILFFIAVVAFPWVAMGLGVENNLSGAEEKVELSFENLDDYILQNFPGRELLVRTKNQIQYSIFDVSPNESITKIEDTLFSTESLNYYYHGLHDVEENDVVELVNKFIKLDRIFKEKKKQFVITTTPSKPRYYDGALPFADDVILAYQGQRNENPYVMLNKYLKQTDLKYFDCIEYIDNNKDIMFGGDVPLFYKSAHHWSNYKGNLVGLAFADYMRKELKLKLPKLKVVASPSNVPKYPDADLFDVLNVYDKPNEKFCESVISYDNYDYEDKSFLIQGGSFLGGFMLPYLTIGINNDVMHIENKVCINDRYKENIYFDDYDDLNDKVKLLERLKKFDVFIFEINELNVYNASFGFLDYLLEHEEYL